MKKIILLILMGLFCFVGVRAQHLKAYQIYNKKEKPVSFSKMIKKLKQYDVVLFGEYHSYSILHWLELRTAEELYKQKKGGLIFGAEMFERDNADIVDAYLDGSISHIQFKKEARLWPNYQTDYKPLLDFAKAHQLKFIATNIPRNYASDVAKGGLDTLNNLSDSERVYMVRLPLEVDMETPGYEEMKELMKQAHGGLRAEDFVSAQAIKDATMAESIYKNIEEGKLFLHFNGDYHTKEYGGIYQYLKKNEDAQKPLKIVVISIARSEENKLPLPKDFKSTEFTIVVPADMTKTY